MWNCTPKKTLYPTKYPVKLFHCDPIVCLQLLMNNLLLQDALQFEPLHIFKTLEKLMCIYSEWWTGDVIWKMQVSCQLFICYMKYWHQAESTTWRRDSFRHHHIFGQNQYFCSDWKLHRPSPSYQPCWHCHGFPNEIISLCIHAPHHSPCTKIPPQE